MKRSILAILLLPLAAASCSKDKPKPGTKVTFDNACDAAFNPTREDERTVNKRVTIEGYLAPKSGFSVCGRSCSLELYEDAAKKGKHVDVWFTVGDGDNQFEKLPRGYSAKDIKVHTHDGKVVDVSKKVRLSGGRDGQAKTCYVSVDLVEVP